MAQQGNLRFTVTATGPIAKGRCVNWNGAQAGANEAIYGIADTPALTGEQVAIIPAGATADAEAGAAINGAERRLMTDAQGRLIPWTTGNIVAARLVPRGLENVASVAGVFVEVAPIWS
jgi:Uncharacterized conserved protein (DUF2190)